MKKKIIISIFLALIISFLISPYFFIKIKLIGNKEITLDYGEKYSESGYKAYLFNKNISDEIKVSNNIKNELGTYKVTYTYNFLFYKIKKNRVVKVADISAPTISLNGDENIEVTIDTEYVEAGATAIDNLDGDLTDNIKITNNININELGEYKVIYEVTDKNDNKKEIIRNVKVEKKRPTQMSVSEYTLDGWYDEVKLKETKKYDNNYYNSVTMVGDSNVMHMYQFGVLSGLNAWGIPCSHPGTMLTDKINLYGLGIQMNLLDAIKTYKPQNVYLNLGTFSTIYLSEDKFLSNSEELILKIKELSPATNLVLVSIYPIAEGDNLPKFTQEKINKFNFYILEMAYKHNVKFLDVQEVLKNEKGYVKNEYILNDKYHLNYYGYNAVKEYIKTHVVEEE